MYYRPYQLYCIEFTRRPWDFNRSTPFRTIKKLRFVHRFTKIRLSDKRRSLISALHSSHSHNLLCVWTSEIRFFWHYVKRYPRKSPKVSRSFGFEFGWILVEVHWKLPIWKFQIGKHQTYSARWNIVIFTICKHNKVFDYTLLRLMHCVLFWLPVDRRRWTWAMTSPKSLTTNHSEPDQLDMLATQPAHSMRRTLALNRLINCNFIPSPYQLIQAEVV